VKYCDSCKYKSDQKKQKKIQPHNALCNKLRRRIKFRNDNYASILRLYQDAYGQYSRRYSYDEILAFIHAVNEKTKSRDYNDIEDFRKFLNEYKPKKEGEHRENFRTDLVLSTNSQANAEILIGQLKQANGQYDKTRINIIHKAVQQSATSYKTGSSAGPFML
jgi:hypothetical protein